MKTIATKPRHKTSWCLQLLELRERAELQAGQMPDELSVFPLPTHATEMCWTTSTWTLPGESRRMYGVSRTQTRRTRRTSRRRHEQFRRMRWQTRPCRSWRFETLCVQRDISQVGVGLFTRQERHNSLMLDGILRQDHTSRRRYLPRMCLQKATSRFPMVKVPFLQIVGEISWPDRRSDDCGCGRV